MMGIFNVFVESIPDFKAYLTHNMFETKVTPTVDKKDKEIIKLDLLVAELFFPQRDKSKEIHD
tara:strand:- start:388 stop:576 length:189 start_codon:yes stop_codon:yes gene_type:complete